MDNIERSILYLKGVIDGCGYDDETPEGRIFSGIVDVLDTMSCEINLISTRGKYCEDMIGEILDDDMDDFDDGFDDDNFVEIECPSCHDVVFFDNDTYNNTENLICPNCSKPL